MENKITIEDMARALVMDGLSALDDGRVREDLMGLFTDIRSELRVKAPDKEKQIYAYAALLQGELDLYLPHKAFEAGAILGCNSEGADNDVKRAFMRYVCRVELDPANKTIHDKVSGLYNELCGVLGDEHGLMDEFTELYRKCNGIIQSKIDCFFDMGYTASRVGVANN